MVCLYRSPTPSGGYFTSSNNFYLTFLCLERKGGGGGGSAPCGAIRGVQIVIYVIWVWLVRVNVKYKVRGCRCTPSSTDSATLTMERTKGMKFRCSNLVVYHAW
jgi:hypothetical protein